MSATSLSKTAEELTASLRNDNQITPRALREIDMIVAVLEMGCYDVRILSHRQSCLGTVICSAVANARRRNASFVTRWIVDKQDIQYGVERVIDILT